MATIFPPSPAVNDEHSNYRWNGTAWKLIGQVYNPTVYENEPPANPQTGDIWIDANENVPSISPETVITISGTQNLTNKTLTSPTITSPTITGTASLPSTTSIGNVSSTEIGYIDGVTSGIQTQLNAKGLNIIIPSSAVVGSGSATIASNGGVSFTGISSISLDNVFSSTFTNYRITMSYSVSSGSPSRLYQKLIKSDGVVTSANNYYWAFHWWNISNGHGVEGSTGTPVSYGNLGVLSNYAGRLSMDVSMQGDTPITSFLQSFDYGSTAVNYVSGVSGPRGIQISPSSGTITGSIHVYGYNKGGL